MASCPVCTSLRLSGSLAILRNRWASTRPRLSLAPDDPSLRWYQVAVLLEMGDSETAAALMAELGEAPGQGQPSPRMVTMQIIRNHLDKGRVVKRDAGGAGLAPE